MLAQAIEPPRNHFRLCITTLKHYAWVTSALEQNETSVFSFNTRTELEVRLTSIKSEERIAPIEGRGSVTDQRPFDVMRASP
jgi:hypothetical protein